MTFPAIVFCGGRGTRIGGLQHGPKTLLPTPEHPILWRLFDQIERAGIGPIIVATTPAYAEAISHSISEREARSPDIGVFVSEAQRAGLLPGLHDVLDTERMTRCIVCLGDIFFLRDPFTAWSEVGDDGNALFVAPRAEPGELSQGGLVLHENGRAIRVVERPVRTPGDGAARWTGAAIIDASEVLDDLREFLGREPDDAPEGDFFQFQIEKGREFQVVAGADFINVNTPDDWLLACLYGQREIVPEDSAAAGALATAAEALRAGLAERGA